MNVIPNGPWCRDAGGAAMACRCNWRNWTRPVRMPILEKSDRSCRSPLSPPELMLVPPGAHNAAAGQPMRQSPADAVATAKISGAGAARAANTPAAVEPPRWIWTDGQPPNGAVRCRHELNIEKSEGRITGYTVEAAIRVPGSSGNVAGIPPAPPGASTFSAIARATWPAQAGAARSSTTKTWA